VTAPTAVTAEQKRDLRQLAGAGAYDLWLSLYKDASTSEPQALAALIRRNAGDVRLAAADMLDGVIDGAETIKKLKIEGELDVEFNPVSYATKSANLRSQVALSAGQARRFGPPLAGMAIGRSDVPQAFRLSDSQLPSDLDRLGTVAGGEKIDRETP